MKKFESITFQVESDLKKPQIYLGEKYISWIFDELFKVGKYKNLKKMEEILFKKKMNL